MAVYCEIRNKNNHNLLALTHKHPFLTFFFLAFHLKLSSFHMGKIRIIYVLITIDRIFLLSSDKDLFNNLASFLPYLSVGFLVKLAISSSTFCSTVNPARSLLFCFQPLIDLENEPLLSWCQKLKRLTKLVMASGFTCKQEGLKS